MERGIRILAIMTAIVLVLALTLVALGIMTWRLFWVIAIAAAIIAYYVIPAMKKKKTSGEEF